MKFINKLIKNLLANFFLLIFLQNKTESDSLKQIKFNFIICNKNLLKVSLRMVLCTNFYQTISSILKSRCKRFGVWSLKSRYVFPDAFPSFNFTTGQLFPESYALGSTWLEVWGEMTSGQFDRRQITKNQPVHSSLNYIFCASVLI